MFVKICGITSEEDALLAVAMGADAVGFVFAPSSRQMQPVQAYDIVRRLPPDILTVGVFRDEAPQRVVDIVHQVGLPYHWGYGGPVKGDSANDLFPFALDPNVHIQEVKAAKCDIRPGRRPRGPDLPRYVESKRPATVISEGKQDLEL